VVAEESALLSSLAPSLAQDCEALPAFIAARPSPNEIMLAKN
jgi:hypothetical protein